MLEGKRIYLRKITSADTDYIIYWRSQEFVRNNFIYQGPFTKDVHENWLKTKVETGNVVQFIIYDKIKNLPIGSVYLRDIDHINSRAEYGIFIGEKDYLGKGIGAEAGTLVLDFAFKDLHLHKIMLKAFAQNVRAIKNYKKAGFIEEGYMKDEVRRGDTYYDIVYMAKINNEI
ncbi:MAG: GNAT family N-acetyltransferase [Lachnospiraceae bacterium]|jgi:RimJ/RimL family protein N-acetyltransferase|nr:GNAT family N-acetyltransferase [Lachnospiraceae bacterium]